MFDQLCQWSASPGERPCPPYHQHLPQTQPIPSSGRTIHVEGRSHCMSSFQPSAIKGHL